MTNRASVLVEAASLSLAQPGDYAELEDEDSPDGAVVFRRKDGRMFAMMPAEDYHALRKQLLAGQHASPAACTCGDPDVFLLHKRGCALEGT